MNKRVLMNVAEHPAVAAVSAHDCVKPLRTRGVSGPRVNQAILDLGNLWVGNLWVGKVVGLVVLTVIGLSHAALAQGIPAQAGQASSGQTQNGPTPSEPDAQVPTRPRFLFLGDSNTYAGHYITWLDVQLRLIKANPMPELINLGLPSETCSGLSEPDHPFPRPNVHERLDRALAKIKPQAVIIAYGMNDGIYHPFQQDRFAAYQRGLRELIEKVRETDAKVILLTPPVFDALPMREAGKLRPADAEQFAWFAIYEDYDQVMQRYAKWILASDLDADLIVDIYTPTRRFLESQREADPAFRTSDDGVHFDRRGHEVVGRAILQAAKMTPVDDVPEELWQIVQDRQQLLRDAWLSHVGHQRPGMANGMPLNEALRKADDLEQKIKALTP